MGKLDRAHPCRRQRPLFQGNRLHSAMLAPVPDILAGVRAYKDGD